MSKQNPSDQDLAEAAAGVAAEITRGRAAWSLISPGKALRMLADSLGKAPLHTRMAKAMLWDMIIKKDVHVSIQTVEAFDNSLQPVEGIDEIWCANFLPESAATPGRTIDLFSNWHPIGKDEEDMWITRVFEVEGVRIMAELRGVEFYEQEIMWWCGHPGGIDPNLNESEIRRGPGRPSRRDEIMAEHKRRLSNNNACGSKAAEAEALFAWKESLYPGDAPMDPETIRKNYPLFQNGHHK